MPFQEIDRDDFGARDERRQVALQKALDALRADADTPSISALGAFTVFLAEDPTGRITPSCALRFNHSEVALLIVAMGSIACIVARELEGAHDYKNAELFTDLSKSLSHASYELRSLELDQAVRAQNKRNSRKDK
jgi:hypothetical protein